MHRLSEYTGELTGLRNYLTSENYSVNQALNGEEAMRTIMEWWQWGFRGLNIPHF